MTKWKFYSLGELGEITSSKRIFEREYVEYGIPSVGDILITAIGTVGEIYVVDNEHDFYFKDGNIIWLKGFNGVDTFFLKYLLSSLINDLRGLSSGSAYKALPIAKLKEYKIPLPPLEEQRRIAAILDKADAVRRKRKEAIALTEELLRSSFLDMFGDPVTNPKEWETASLGDLLAEPLQNGAYFQKEYYVDDGTGTEMVHMSDAFYGVVKRGNLKRVTVTSADIEKYGLNSNDVIIARRSLNYEGAAKPCLISIGQEPLIFESSLIRVRVNRDVLDPIFFFSYMLQPRARSAFVFPHVTRSTISGINQAGLQRVQVLVPPISIQMNYRKLYEKVTSFGTVYKRDLDLSETFFNSLLQIAFRGQL